MTLLNPGRDLGAQHIHGIRAGDVLDAPAFADVGPYLAALLAGRAFVGHDVGFDRRFVQAEFADCGLGVPDLAPLSLCTMQWSGRLLPILNRSLAGCCACAGIALTDAHEALADARAAASLLGVLVERAPAIPWKDTLVEAAAASWASAARPGRPVAAHRRGASSVREHFLARLVEAAPPPPDDEDAAAYVATLDRALLDRFLSEREQRALVALAADLHIDRPTAQRLHLGYLQELAGRAVSDGVVTPDERADLDAVAELLGLRLHAVDDALADAATAAVSGTAPDAFGLRPGDLVVFTGEMSRPRSDWEAVAAAAGLLPHGAVTKKVALVVAADPDSLSGKARKAADYGIPIVGEQAFARMVAALV